MVPRRKGGIRLGIKFGGLLLLSLGVLFALGGCAWIREWLNPNHAPVAVIRANPTSGEAPLEVLFDASESYDPDGDEIVSYQWDFGDDNNLEGGVARHSFISPGNYSVTLCVSDGKKLGSSSITITVLPTADASMSTSFDTRTGLEYDTGTGLRLSIPPDPSQEGKAELLVKYYASPPEISQWGRLHSAYEIDLNNASSSSSPLTPFEEFRNCLLTMQIPQLPDLECALIVCKSGSNWVVAPNNNGPYGGVIPSDNTSISIRVNHFSLYGLFVADGKELATAFSNSEPTEVLSSAPPLAPEHTGTIVIPRSDFRGGEGQNVSIYVPPLVNSSNAGLDEDGWRTVEEITRQGVHFNWWKLAASFEPSEAGSPEGAAFALAAALFKAFASVPEIIGVDILVQANKQGDLRAVLQIADPQQITWQRRFAGTSQGVGGLNPHVELKAKFVQDMAQAFGLPPTHNYWIRLESDVAHRNDPFIGYLSVNRDGKLVFTPKIYEGDKISIVHFEFPFRPVTDLEIPISNIRPLSYILGEDASFFIIDLLVPIRLESEPERVPPVVLDFSVNQKSITLGDSFTFEFTVADNGGSDLKRVELWRANDDGGSPVNWKKVGSTPVSGENYSGVFTDVPPLAGTYWYGLHVVDNAGNSNDERNSNTNGSPGVYGPIKVQVVSEKPDLTITAVSPSESSIPTGGKVLVTFTVENQGPPITQEFKNSVFLSNREYMGDQDILLGEVPMVLDGDKNRTETVEVTIPQVPPGDWYLAVYVDAGEDVEESNENNNIDSVPITITASQQKNQPPVIEALTATPSTVEPGGQSRVSVSAHDPEDDPLTYSWSASGGRLSSTTGPGDKIWTAPNTPGTYQVTVSVTDNKPGHSPVSRSVDLTVVARLTITTASLPAGQVGQSYRATLRATGGAPPYRWSIKAGSLPSGLSLDPTTGVISGAPAESGTFHFTVQVRDSASQTIEKDFSISIASSVIKPHVSTDSAADIGETSATLKGFLDSTGGEECQVWFEYGTTASYGHSTPKQALNTAGPFSAHISGLKPNTTYHFKACASNSRGTTCGKDATFRTKAKIDQLPQIMRPQENEVFQAEVGKVFTLQIEAQDPEGQKLVYMLTEWPSSLTLNRDTGLIQWTPTVDFTGKKVKVTFYVSDRPIGQTAGREVYRTFYIEVQEKADTTPPTVVATNPADGDLGAPITDTITVTFSEEIRRSKGSVTIIDENNNRIAIQGISVSGCVLTIRLANRLAYSTEYAVGIGAGVVTDLAGNPNPEYSWAFRTRAPQAPPSPDLVAPPNGATVSTTPTLQWNPVSGAKGYAVQVARDSGFGAKVFDQVVSSTSVQVNPALDAGSRYFWRVAAMGEGESISSWSDVWSFTTRPPSLPDLVVEDIWTEPSPPIASKYTTIGVKIRNQGERDITRTIYLELFFDGVFKGRASINGLAAGATRTSKWQTMKWPSDTNYHTIRCIVDPDNIVTESNETNNARSEQFKANRLTFTKLWPTTIETSESTYQATLYATGSNFLNVIEVSFSWSGPTSNSETWRKGDSDWNAKVKVESDSSMVLKPRVLFNWRSTQRKTWNWTVTLKDNTGATASQSFTVIYNPPGPPKITSASPSPNSTAPGRTITITYDVTNPGSARQVLLGASIRLSGGPTLSDPANDIKVTLPSGSSSVSRRFTVATTAPLGTYDLLVSIVEDTNNNGKIDSSDQLLDFATFDDVLQVVKFSKGDAVEVYNTGGKGLLVLDAPCGKKIGAKFDGETGTILKGPVYCAGYNRWQIRWSDGLVGWSAEDWLRLLE